MRVIKFALLIAVSLFGLSGLTKNRDQTIPEPIAALPPVIVVDQTGVSTTRISVLIYNVRGLPWPIARGRRKALEEIGAELRRLQEVGEAPDVLLIQEAFTEEAGRIGALAAYPYHAIGPQAEDQSAPHTLPLDPEFLAGQRFFRGEALGKVLSSGLTIHSRYPISVLRTMPFGRDSCAGYDCLANKGVMLVAVAIPGAPDPVQIVNTHLNSNKASGASEQRSLVAHKRQIDEINSFLEHNARIEWPLIFGGDFNVRNSGERYAHADRRMPGIFVHHYCSVIVSYCDVRLSWNHKKPWMRTQDHQGFADGTRMRVRPVRVEAMFDTPHNGRLLSDHHGLLVRYEISWPAPDRQAVFSASSAFSRSPRFSRGRAMTEGG